MPSKSAVARRAFVITMRGAGFTPATRSAIAPELFARHGGTIKLPSKMKGFPAEAPG